MVNNHFSAIQVSICGDNKQTQCCMKKIEMVHQGTQYEPPFNVDLAIADFPESPNNQDHYSTSEKEDPEWLPENDEESDYEYEDTP